MQSPLRLTFRHVDRSPALEARVHDLIGRLEKFHDRITACHVVIEAPNARPGKGRPFDVSIELAIPGGFIHAHGTHGNANEGHADVYAALSDAFDSARRQLQNVGPMH